MSVLTAASEAVTAARARTPRWSQALVGLGATGLLWFVLAATLSRGMPAGIVVMGLVFGSLYALGAIGLVLVYQANRIVNFAQADLGSVAAVLAIELRVQYHVSYVVAVVTGIVLALVVGAMVDFLVVRWFQRAPRLILTVASIGVAQILAGFAVQIPLWFEEATVFQSTPFTTPFEARFVIEPVTFNGNHVMAMVVVPVILVALVWFLRSTDYGVAIRAAAENGERAVLLGIPVRRLSTIVWAIAAALSATAVILRVPIVGFLNFTSVSGGGPFLLLRILAAAVIARMESLPTAVVAALAIGVFEKGATWTFANETYSDALLVAVILVVLLVRRGAFSRATETGIATWKALREIRPIPRELRDLPEVRFGLLGLRLALLVSVVAFPLWATPAREQLVSLIFIYAILAVSLVVLTGWAGQISLGHFALTGFGGAATSVLLERHGWDLFLALPAGALVAAGAALLIGLPALRMSGPFLAVTTLAFAVTSSSYLLEDRYFPWFIESQVERPVLWSRFRFEEDWQMYYLCLIVLAFAIAGVRSLRNSRPGRAMIAARDNELAVQAVSASATRLKLTAFLVSGALAGLAGGLYVLHQRGLKTDAFGPEVSLLLFSMVVIGGLGSIPGAILGATYIRGVQYFLSGGWALVASGVGVLVLLMVMPGGLSEGMYRVRDAALRRIARRRGLVVPSLLADVQAETGEGVPVALDEALARLARARRNDDADPSQLTTTGRGARG